MTQARYCVVVPAFNAARTLSALVRAIRSHQLDVIVVDDGSSDATAQAASAQGAVVISHVRNQGKGAALRSGFRHAMRHAYEAVITMDSDGQHDPLDLPLLIEATRRQDAGIVIGNRMQRTASMPMLRRWTNRLMSRIISMVSGQQIPDTQSGFRLIRRDVLASIALASNHFDVESEMLLAAARRGWPIVSIPVTTIYNGHESHIHPLWDGVRFLRLVLRYCGPMSP